MLRTERDGRGPVVDRCGDRSERHPCPPGRSGWSPNRALRAGVGPVEQADVTPDPCPTPHSPAWGPRRRYDETAQPAELAGRTQRSARNLSAERELNWRPSAGAAWKHRASASTTSTLANKHTAADREGAGRPLGGDPVQEGSRRAGSRGSSSRNYIAPPPRGRASSRKSRAKAPRSDRATRMNGWILVRAGVELLRIKRHRRAGPCSPRWRKRFRRDPDQRVQNPFVPLGCDSRRRGGVEIIWKHQNEPAPGAHRLRHVQEVSGVPARVRPGTIRFQI